VSGQDPARETAQRATEPGAEGGLAAQLAAGIVPAMDGEPDRPAGNGRERQRVAAQVRAVQTYLERYPAERQRIDAMIRDGWAEASQDRTRFAFLAAQVRAHMVSTATLDQVDRALPAAAARLRDDLDDYLATIEGLTFTAPCSELHG
jgi:hypothetical protein